MAWAGDLLGTHHPLATRLHAPAGCPLRSKACMRQGGGVCRSASGCGWQETRHGRHTLAAPCMPVAAPDLLTTPHPSIPRAATAQLHTVHQRLDQRHPGYYSDVVLGYCSEAG